MLDRKHKLDCPYVILSTVLVGVNSLAAGKRHHTNNSTLNSQARLKMRSYRVICGSSEFTSRFLLIFGSQLEFVLWWCDHKAIESFTHHINNIDKPQVNLMFSSLMWPVTQKKPVSSHFWIPYRQDPNGFIKVSVNLKATHTDQYSDFQSHHPLEHKISVVRTCTEWKTLLQNPRT